MEYEGNEDELEADANRFAREFLAPTKKIIEARNRHKGKMPIAAGRALADELGVSSGIVAGRLHFDGVWKPVTGNELKIRYPIGELISNAI